MARGKYKRNKIKIHWWFDYINNEELKKRTNRLVRRENKAMCY